MSHEPKNNNDKPVVEYIARITMPNGEIIEKSVSTVGPMAALFAIPPAARRSASRAATWPRPPASDS